MPTSRKIVRHFYSAVAAIILAGPLLANSYLPSFDSLHEGSEAFAVSLSGIRATHNSNTLRAFVSVGKASELAQGFDRIQKLGKNEKGTFKPPEFNFSSLPSINVESNSVAQQLRENPSVGVDTIATALYETPIASVPLTTLLPPNNDKLIDALPTSAVNKYVPVPDENTGTVYLLGCALLVTIPVRRHFVPGIGAL